MNEYIWYVDDDGELHALPANRDALIQRNIEIGWELDNPFYSEGIKTLMGMSQLELLNLTAANEQMARKLLRGEMQRVVMGVN